MGAIQLYKRGLCIGNILGVLDRFLLSVTSCIEQEGRCTGNTPTPKWSPPLLPCARNYAIGRTRNNKKGAKAKVCICDVDEIRSFFGLVFVRVVCVSFGAVFSDSGAEKGRNWV